jgi:hypothetical protein
MHEKPLGFWSMDFGVCTKTKHFFVFLRENEFKIFLMFLNFQKKFKKSFGENGYFNIRFVSYSVNIQPDIMQNYWKNKR